jgi:hypothetical protein
MVRIRDEDHEMVRARRRGRDVDLEVVCRLSGVSPLHFLYGLAEDFAALRVRDEDWKAEIEERREWDRALDADIENE